MENINVKPALVPTLYSARVAAWGFIYLLAFGLAVFVYDLYGKIESCKKELNEPQKTAVATGLFKMEIPAGWHSYLKKDNSVIAFKKAYHTYPVIAVSALKSDDFEYHALDLNQTIGASTIANSMSEIAKGALEFDTTLTPVGSEAVTVKPGISALRIILNSREQVGEALIFFVGNVRYLVWGFADSSDKRSRKEISLFCKHVFDNLRLPELSEHFNRPIVHSGRITSELNEEVRAHAEREFALWKLFSERVEQEPETAMLPAILHYRSYLELLSSVRQERLAMGTDDFKLYNDYLARRKASVGEWFVMLDKLVAMKDTKGAKKQAKWIVKHATLYGELADRRRATKILESLNKEVK